jgi:transposase
MMESCSDERYSFFVSKSCYGNQSVMGFVLFRRNEKREEKTFDEKILKDLEATEKSLKNFPIMNLLVKPMQE